MKRGRSIHSRVHAFEWFSWSCTSTKATDSDAVQSGASRCGLSHAHKAEPTGHRVLRYIQQPAVPHRVLSLQLRYVAPAGRLQRGRARHAAGGGPCSSKRGPGPGCGRARPVPRDPPARETRAHRCSAAPFKILRAGRAFRVPARAPTHAPTARARGGRRLGRVGPGPTPRTGKGASGRPAVRRGGSLEGGQVVVAGPGAAPPGPCRRGPRRLRRQYRARDRPFPVGRNRTIRPAGLGPQGSAGPARP
jgi:hypothetical protein